MDAIPVICQALGVDATPVEGLHVTFYTPTHQYRTSTARDGRVDKCHVVYYITIYIGRGAYNIYYETGPNLVTTLLNRQGSGEERQDSTGASSTDLPALHKLYTNFVDPAAPKPLLVEPSIRSPTSESIVKDDYAAATKGRATEVKRKRGRRTRADQKKGAPGPSRRKQKTAQSSPPASAGPTGPTA
ncbi:hypothetical protein LX32DRAFT_659122, partial [Colletotrichum zoysiae]